jgi:hypothetical protein
LGAALPFCQQQNPEPDFSDDERIDRDLCLVPSEPCDHVEIRRRLGRLAQDVRLDKELHSVSVDSVQSRRRSPSPDTPGASQRRLRSNASVAAPIE